MSVSAADFQIFAPLSFFEKADAEDGKRRRIGGVVNTEFRDKQKELLVQKGLDFSPFQTEGWFNDNHSKETAGVVGLPDGEVRKFQKGERLPDGETARHNCSWAEGYLLETPRANDLWSLGRALQKSGAKRRLGFSIEGQVLSRSPYDRNVVTRALVKNIAITHCPVGEDTRMEILAKSMEEAEKALSMGAAHPGENASAAGPTTGEGAGRIITPQDLESGKPSSMADAATRVVARKQQEDDEQVRKSHVAALRIRFNCDEEMAERAYRTLLNLKAAGALLGA